MMRSSLRHAWVATVALLSIGALAPAAMAHESAQEGEVEIVVGFGTEPAYTGQPNSVQVVVRHGGEPLTRLRDDLVVEVAFGDERAEYRLEPFFVPGEFGTPGDYRAWFVPSEPGRYTFTIRGRVEGQAIDESFTAGPDTFSPVQDVSDATFPPTQAPSNAELADRIEAEAGRTQRLLASTLDAAARGTEAAEDVGTVALVLAAIGTIVAIGAFAASRRPGG